MPMERLETMTYNVTCKYTKKFVITGFLNAERKCLSLSQRPKQFSYQSFRGWLAMCGILSLRVPTSQGRRDCCGRRCPGCLLWREGFHGLSGSLPWVCKYCWQYSGQEVPFVLALSSSGQGGHPVMVTQRDGAGPWELPWKRAGVELLPCH